MSESAKVLLNERIQELSALIEANPIFLPVSSVATFLHVKPDALRASEEADSTRLFQASAV